MPYVTVITFVAFDTLAAADLNSNFSNLDYLNSKINSQIVIMASAMMPRAAVPASPGEAEMATNDNNYTFMDFPDGSNTYAIASFPLPSDYNGGTITAKFYWTANSTSTNSVVWHINAVCIADDQVLDVAQGTDQSVADANKSTAYKLNVSDSTAAITIAGTPAAGELCHIQIIRNTAAGSDTLAATARLIAVVLTYTRS